MPFNRIKWFVGAWVVVMASLAAMAWIVDGPQNSWRFFGMFAVIFTAYPLAVLLITRGVESK